MTRIIRPRLAPLALCALLVACGRGDDGTGALQSARAHYDKRDYKAAIIEAKTALQRKEDNAQARLVLGQALLEAGEPVAAAVELRKALEGGVDAPVAVPPLAQAMLAQGDARSVVLEFGETTFPDAAATAALQTTVATARARQGDRTGALEGVEAVLRRAPEHVPAQLLRARLVAAGGDAKGALALVDAVLARDPNETDALMLSGDLQGMANADADAALARYRRAAEADPKAIAAHVAIVDTLLRRRDVEGARAQFGKMQAAQPNHPETRLIEARLTLLAKDFEKTRQIAQQLLKVYPGDPRVLQVAGAAEMQLNNLAPAENLLVQAVKAAPRAPMPRRMLAEVQLRGGQPKRALDTLGPLLGADADAKTLTLAGQAWGLTGDAKKSQDAFARAAKLDPEATMARTALALGQMAKGNLAGGFAELEAVAAGDSGIQADLSLIAARLRARDADGALKAIGALEKKQPGEPIAHALRGKVLALRNDLPGAKASYDKALAIDPGYLPAVAGLAEMDLAASKPDDARARLRALVKADPKNARAQLTLAQLLARTGAPRGEVTQQLMQAAQVAPGDATPRIALVDYLLSQGDAKAAVVAAQEASVALPSSVEVLDRLGSAQLAAGEPQQAAATLAKIVATHGDRAGAHLRLAEAQFAAKDYTATLRSLNRALELEPGSVPAQLGLARLAMTQERYPDAIDVARRLQKSRPDLASGFLVEADIEAHRKQPEAEIAALRRGVPLAGGAESAVRLDRALRAAGKSAEADRTALQWVKSHPRHAAFRHHLGDVSMAGGDLAGAESHYRAVIDIQPDNALVLNNLAWLMAQQNKPGAVALAERANALLPERAPLMDTLTVALLAEGKAQRAFEVQKKALAAFPDEPGLKLTMAKVYLKLGDREQARTQLEALAKLGPRFPAQAEIATLMKAL